MNDSGPSPHPKDGGDADAAGTRWTYTPRRLGARTILRAARRRLLLLCAVLGATIALAALVTALGTALSKPTYVATAEVEFDPGGATGASARSIDERGTGIAIIRSREMARAVAAALDGRGRASRQDVDALLRHLSVTRVEGTYTLTIAFEADDPQTAARVANAFAEQYSRGGLAGATGGVSPIHRSNSRIISRAEPPLAPASPDWPLNLAFGAVVGAVLGLAAAAIAEMRRSGLTSGSEIEERLGLHHLGSVPTVESVLARASAPLEAVVEAPMSAFAEAFRSVLMSIRHAGGRGTQVIVITSALPDEGKTTITACLARTVALAGDSVVLVDCDSRRRDTSALFVSGGRRPGLAEVLRYEATLDEALVRDPASGAWVLPLTGPPADLSELLGGAAMDSLLGDLRRRFKRVLIDTAPVLPISGTRAIAEMADLVVLVVRWRRTADHAVAAALRLLPGKHVRIGGVVLSQVDMRKQVKFAHGDPSFYYKQYSKYYD